MKTKVKLTDEFFGNYRELIRKEMIPYQWKVLNDEISVNIERERDDASIPNEKSHCLENFRIAAGQKEGTHYGYVFQDSDLYKWLEAVAYSLREKPDDELKALADSAVDLIGEAQEEDGYLDTYFTIGAPNRKFKRLCESHELYCAGHYMEAACAYYTTTGNKKALDIAIKLADYLDGYFGDGKHFGYDGHEEVEIGLMKLYEVTGEKRYMKLAEYFLTIRGTDVDFLEKQRKEDGPEGIIFGDYPVDNVYLQNYMPVVDQVTAEGHAVRLVYMCEAMAHVAALGGNEKLLDACRKIFRNIVDKRMYITGGIGSTYHGERFTFDYDLPNDTMYCESCASVGLFHFMYRMLQCEAKGEYADTMEKALYNTILGGMALDGKHFFYVNPLESNPEAYRHDPGKSHVKPVRAAWLGCACCPPNLARCLTSLQEYIYVVKGNTILVNLFMNNEMSAETDGYMVTINQETKYPKDGRISFVINVKRKENVSAEGAGKGVSLGIRIPGWADQYDILVNGKSFDFAPVDGYAYFECPEGETDIELSLLMEPVRWYANGNINADRGKVAILRGPVVYCVEEADNGPDVFKIKLPYDASLKYDGNSDAPGNMGCIEADGLVKIVGDTEPLYSKCGKPTYESKKIKYIPYFAWGNRGEGRMQVWTME